MTDEELSEARMVMAILLHSGGAHDSLRTLIQMSWTTAETLLLIKQLGLSINRWSGDAENTGDSDIWYAHKQLVACRQFVFDELLNQQLAADAKVSNPF